MTNLICFLFVSCGISALWSLSDIFMPVRNIVAKKFPSFFRKMLLCMECSGFWIGAACSLIFFEPTELITHSNLLLNKIILAIYGGTVTHLAIKIINKKELI